ncbi:hypothetical protein Y1Q_0008856 [Alligator mississippiensis]|uniref:Uncharacterized protein n=1 Tax=Alligator mississippiensis TaxID=8496 RepID=A0A151NA93_ALLMI|nr:hypothetical protein Y1Q_0008856 [Alligator mississippiensis]
MPDASEPNAHKAGVSNSPGALGQIQALGFLIDQNLSEVRSGQLISDDKEFGSSDGSRQPYSSDVASTLLSACNRGLLSPLVERRVQSRIGRSEPAHLQKIWLQEVARVLGG